MRKYEAVLSYSSQPSKHILQTTYGRQIVRTMLPRSKHHCYSSADRKHSPTSVHCHSEISLCEYSVQTFVKQPSCCACHYNLKNVFPRAEVTIPFQNRNRPRECEQRSAI